MSDTTAQVVPWPVLRGHLESLLARSRDQMDDASDDEVKRLQGEVRVLKKLLNLPETLAMLQEEDRRVEAQKGKRQ